jgi:hypothetical protein
VGACTSELTTPSHVQTAHAAGGHLHTTLH